MSEQVLTQAAISDMVGFAREEVTTRKTTILSQHDGFEVRLVEETSLDPISRKPIGSYCARCTVFSDGGIVYVPIECPKGSITT